MAEAPQRWEYLVEPTISPERLKALGWVGWELAIFDERDGNYVFRRPIRSFVERVTLEQRARYYQSRGLDPDR